MPGLTALQVKNAAPGLHADGRTVPDGTRQRIAILGIPTPDRWQATGLWPGAGQRAVPGASSGGGSGTAHPPPEQRADPPAKTASPALAPTFAAAAACHEAIKGGWSNKRHSDSWLVSVEQHAFPVFGDLPVDEIGNPVVRDALAPIWLTIPETARRILQRIGTVLDFAHIEGWRVHEAALRSIPRGLPRQPAEENHYPAMPYDDVPAFIAELHTLSAGAGRDALFFTIPNAVRSGETRHAT